MKTPEAQPHTSNRMRKEGMNTIWGNNNQKVWHQKVWCSVADSRPTFFKPWKKGGTLSLSPLDVGGVGGALYQNATRAIRNEAMAGMA